MKHSEKAKEQYAEARKKYRYGYEEELLNWSNGLILEADRKIEKGRARVKEDAAEELSTEEIESEPDVVALKVRLAEKAEAAEEAGDAGDVELSRLLTEEVEELDKQRNILIQVKLQEKLLKLASTQKLRVCDACGAFLSATDSQVRLQDHYEGRVHMGFNRVRELVKELKVWLEEEGSGLPYADGYPITGEQMWGELRVDRGRRGEGDYRGVAGQVADRDRRGGSREGHKRGPDKRRDSRDRSYSRDRDRDRRHRDRDGYRERDNHRDRDGRDGRERDGRHRDAHRDREGRCGRDEKERGGDRRERGHSRGYSRERDRRYRRDRDR
eukprot:GHVR01012373.1.p1 GENE.GHVR01012373.1~~GHVR01012373.1.p1  ORF type:complete len:327 (+),score=111.15 GHVR01012373.1:158-1138(+)